MYLPKDYSWNEFPINLHVFPRRLEEEIQESIANYQLGKMEALDAGYHDLVWLDHRGYVAEGPASNIFLIKNNILYTLYAD